MRAERSHTTAPYGQAEDALGRAGYRNYWEDGADPFHMSTSRPDTPLWTIELPERQAQAQGQGMSLFMSRT